MPTPSLRLECVGRDEQGLPNRAVRRHGKDWAQGSANCCVPSRLGVGLERNSRLTKGPRRAHGKPCWSVGTAGGNMRERRLFHVTNPLLVTRHTGPHTLQPETICADLNRYIDNGREVSTPRTPAGQECPRRSQPGSLDYLRIPDGSNLQRELRAFVFFSED